MATAPEEQHDDFAKLAAIGAELGALSVRALASANAFSPQALEHVAMIHEELAAIFDRADNARTADAYRGFARELRERAAPSETAG
ncbi:MAG: hypothetical protein H7X93_07120 [Sphingomonadaceae bacterium]|nr:hypothetical protein [Sphingomonadaceae bacterium]